MLLILAAFGALFAFATSIPSVRSAGSGTFVVESWRLFGYLFFAGIFLLLAYRPRAYPGVWELVILQKAALVVFLTASADSAVDASVTAVADGVLVIVLGSAYLLAEGYRGWYQTRGLQEDVHRAIEEPNQ